MALRGNFFYGNTKPRTAQVRHILMPFTSSHRSGKQPKILSPHGRLHPLATNSAWQQTSSCAIPGARCRHTSGISTPLGRGEPVSTCTGVNEQLLCREAGSPGLHGRTGPASRGEAGTRHRGGSGTRKRLQGYFSENKKRPG